MRRGQRGGDEWELAERGVRERFRLAERLHSPLRRPVEDDIGGGESVILPHK